MTKNNKTLPEKSHISNVRLIRNIDLKCNGKMRKIKKMEIKIIKVVLKYHINIFF